MASADITSTDHRIAVTESCIRIKDLRLRTYVGLNREEQEKRQDVVINITIDYDGLRAARSDHPDQALNYRTITKEVIELVENNRFQLLEKLVHDILALTLRHQAAQEVEVEVDKPHALRFADSVSLTMTGRRAGSHD